jgi:AcrR family transcriptional regulator
MSDAKDALIRAGEHLFARNGVHQTRVRELNELAGQRNASALHYHFGSRDGLLRAIYERHSRVVDADRAERLGRLNGTGSPSLHDLIEIIVGPLADHLERPSGRDYLRIVPQLFTSEVSPPAITRAFELAREALATMPPAIRDERLMSMLRAATALLAERASALENGGPLALDAAGFTANLIDMATGMLTAPVSTGARIV